MKIFSTISRAGLITIGMTLVAANAFGHARLVDPIPRTTDLNGLKGMPCGTLNGQPNLKSATPKVLVAGSVITVTYVELINHPAQYFIRFSPNIIDNEADFQDPANLLKQIDSDVGAVNVNRTTQITVPTTLCDNCTLQFTQLMLESNTYYYSCADIKIVAAGGTPPPPPPPGPAPAPTPGGGGVGAQGTSQKSMPGFGCGRIDSNIGGGPMGGANGGMMALLFLLPMMLLLMARQKVYALGKNSRRTDLR